MSFKKMTPITMKAINPIKNLPKPATTTHTNSTARPSPRSTKWSRKTKKTTFHKLLSTKCGNRNSSKTQNCLSIAKSTNNTWCKKTPRTSYMALCVKTFLSGTSSPNPKAKTSPLRKSLKSHFPNKKASQSSTSPYKNSSDKPHYKNPNTSTQTSAKSWPQRMTSS